MVLQVYPIFRHTPNHAATFPSCCNEGTVKRSVDTHFIHANCDVDLIMEDWEDETKAGDRI